MSSTADFLNACSPLEAALAYAAGGWPVFPVYEVANGCCACGETDCASPGKHPRTLNGRLDATLDQGQIKDWWRRQPNANPATPTGGESGLDVIDLDGNPDLLIPELEKRGVVLPVATPTVRTGSGGLHVITAHPSRKIPTKTKFLKLPSANGGKPPAVDLLADPGYIVLPPAMHKSGQRYQWLKDPFSVGLAPLPPALLDLIYPEAKPGPSFSEPDVEPMRHIDQLLNKLEAVRRSASGWTARCPAHEDHHPSLHIKIGDDGRILLHCFGGCSPEAVVGAIGLSMRDLFDSSTYNGGGRTETGSSEKSQAAGGELKPLSVLPAAEYLAHPFPPVSNILVGGNLTAGGKLLIAGTGGIGKSLIDISLGICLTARRPVFGEFAVTAPQRVGLFLCEDPAGVTQDRLRRQLAGMGLSEPPDGLFMFPRDERLIFGGRHGKPQEAIDRLTETVRRHALSVVIFDPLVAIHEADENSNMEMARWLFPFGEALQHEGCAIIVSHHTTWGQDGEPHSRGASAIQNWADSVWLLRRIETGGREAVKLSVAKINFGPRWEPLILTLDPESLLYSAQGEQSALCPVPALLEYLRDEHGGEFRGKKDDLYSQVQAHFGAGRRTVREAFRAALSHQPPLLEDLGRGGGFKVIE